jgi:NarL family two-component system response regulator LiaR
LLEDGSRTFAGGLLTECGPADGRAATCATRVMTRIHVLLAGGRKITREALSGLLASQPDIGVVGEVEALEAVSKIAAAAAVDVVVYLSAEVSGAFARQVRDLGLPRPGVRVVALLIDPARVDLWGAFEAGVGACLGKECSSGELLAAIRAVYAGGTYLSPRAVDAVVARRGSARVPGFAGAEAGAERARLSRRELEVVRRVAEGESTKEIARELGVSTKTVETHRQRAMTKLGVHTVAGLTKFAVREGITSLDGPVGA